MSRKQEPEVLVVGAGPVGLLAALLLRKQDVRVAIIDQNQRASQHSYALALHPGTLDFLDEVGLSEALVRRGRPVGKVAFYDGTDRRAEVDFAVLDRKYPFVLVLRQSVLERAIEEELERLDVEVLWNHRLQALRDREGGVAADVARLDRVTTGYPVQRTDWVVAKTLAWNPTFVIGADGFDSAVRRFTHIELKTFAPGMLISVFEIEADGELPEEARVVLEADSSSAYWPLEAGRCRWGFEIRTTSEHEPTIERLQALLRTRAPWFNAQATRIYWSTVALFESRVAERFGKGHAWLAGDSAHLATPFGVQSMNVGLREARDLATSMAGILRRGAASSLDSEYESARQAEWRRLLEQGPSVDPPTALSPWVGQLASRILASLPASGDDLPPLLRQLGLAPRL